MLTSVLKIVGAAILSIAIVWGLVLGWWQANDYQPTGLELMLYLGALPLALIGGFLLLKGFIDHLKNPPDLPVPPDTKTTDCDPLTSAAAKTAAAERGYGIALQWTSAVAAPGTAGSEILDAVAAGARPGPDAGLLDDAGFPVFAARVTALDGGHLAEWLAAHQDNLPRPFLDGEPARALALLDLVLPAALHEARDRLEKSQAGAKLRVLWLVPADWERDHHPALQVWLRSTYLNDFEKSQLEVKVKPIETDVQALMEVDELILAIKREQLEKDVHLLLGATSYIGESAVHRWAAQNRLFTPNRQDGQIPGECAVCLMFMGIPESFDATSNEAVRVSRISSAMLNKAVDTGGRITSAPLEQLSAGAMTIRGIDAAEVKKIIADCDHRANRIIELMTVAAQLFKDLEPMIDCHAIGTVCGTTSPLGGLLALACSREMALAEAGSVVCLSNQDAVARAVLVVEPFPIPFGDEEPIHEPSS